MADEVVEEMIGVHQRLVEIGCALDSLSEGDSIPVIVRKPRYMDANRRNKISGMKISSSFLIGAVGM